MWTNQHIKRSVNGRWLATSLALVLLAGCSGSDQYADIRAFITEVENKPLGKIAPLPEFEPYQPFTYGAANRRSPFEPPIVVPPKTDDKNRTEA